MIIDSMDGAYYLVTLGPHEDGPTVPRDADSVTVSTIQDFALITTFEPDVDVEVSVTVLNSPFRQSGPFGWEVRASGELDVSGALRVTDMEFDPGQGPFINIVPGRYLVEVHASSADFRAKNAPPQGWESDCETHLIYLSPMQQS